MTTIPAVGSEPEHTLTLTPETLAAFPYFVGGSAESFAAKCDAGSAEPRHVYLVLKAGLIGAGVDARTAEGTVARLRLRPSGGLPQLAAAAVREALEA